MNDPGETAAIGILFWMLLTVAVIAVPTIVIVMAINGVRDEIRRLVEALGKLDQEDDTASTAD